MKGKIDLLISCKQYGVNFRVESRAVLVDMRYYRPFGKNNSSLLVEPAYELSFVALQDVCDMHCCLDKLDSKDAFVIKDLDAEYYTAVDKNGKEYYGIRVNLGTDAEPFYKKYIIKNSLERRFKKIKPQYQFTEATFNTTEEDEELEDNTNSEILD